MGRGETCIDRLAGVPGRTKENKPADVSHTLKCAAAQCPGRFALSVALVERSGWRRPGDKSIGFFLPYALDTRNTLGLMLNVLKCRTGVCCRRTDGAHIVLNACGITHSGDALISKIMFLEDK